MPAVPSLEAERHLILQDRGTVKRTRPDRGIGAVDGGLGRGRGRGSGGRGGASVRGSFSGSFSGGFQGQPKPLFQLPTRPPPMRPLRQVGDHPRNQPQVPQEQFPALSAHAGPSRVVTGPLVATPLPKPKLGTTPQASVRLCDALKVAEQKKERERQPTAPSGSNVKASGTTGKKKGTGAAGSASTSRSDGARDRTKSVPPKAKPALADRFEGKLRHRDRKDTSVPPKVKTRREDRFEGSGR